MERNGNTCYICGYIHVPTKGPISIATHILNEHGLTWKEYYDKFLKKPGEGVCPICNQSSEWGKYAYYVHCSKECASQSRSLRMKDNKWVKTDEFKKNSSIATIKNAQDQNTDFGFINYRGQPTQIYYKGIRFRSEDEKEFAILLDQFNFHWQFESKIFCYDGIHNTLIDFYLSDLDLWVEVKAKNYIDKETKEKLSLVRELYNIKICLLHKAQFSKFFSEIVSATKAIQGQETTNFQSANFLE